MDESTFESRFPTSTRPSSRPRVGRRVKPRSCVRNVSQYLIRRGTSILRSTFSMDIYFAIRDFNKAEFRAFGPPALCFGLQHFFDAAHQVLGAERLGDV